MNTSLSRRVVVAALLGGLAILPLRAADAGIVDFGQLVPAPNHEFVEINLKPGLLKFASKIVARDEPETAELLNNVRHIRVNVVGLDQSNREATVKRIEEIRAGLEKAGWEKIVTVKSAKGHESDDVAIFMKALTEDAIDGVVVTVIGQDGQAVLVNIAGHIRPEQITKIADRFNIEPLRQLKLPPKAEKTDKPDKTA